MEETNFSHMIYSTNQIAFGRKIVLTIDIVQIRIVKEKHTNVNAATVSVRLRNIRHSY